MLEQIFCILGALFAFGIIFWVIISYHLELYRTHTAYSNGIDNRDPSTGALCYQVKMSTAQIRDTLSRCDVYTSTKYRFDSQNDIITFFSEVPDGQVDISYSIHTQEFSEYTQLRITQINWLFERNKFIFLQNEFWKQKLNAEPVSYKQT